MGTSSHYIPSKGRVGSLSSVLSRPVGLHLSESFNTHCLTNTISSDGIKFCIEDLFQISSKVYKCLNYKYAADMYESANSLFSFS